jgi:hypothetical protein
MKHFVLPTAVFCIFMQVSCAAPALLQQQENTNGTTRPSPIVQSQHKTNQPANQQPEANSQNDNTYIYQTPGGVKRQIVFPRGRTSTTVKGRVVRMDSDTYTVSARENQQMTVSITSIESNASFYVYSSDEKSLSGSTDVKRWSGKLPTTGDYIIEVGAARGNATYKLNVSIK